MPVHKTRRQSNCLYRENENKLTHRLRQLVDLFLHLDVPERAAVRVTGRVQVIVVPRAGHLNSLQVLFRGEAADDEGEVVRRARRGACQQNTTSITLPIHEESNCTYRAF